MRHEILPPSGSFNIHTYNPLRIGYHEFADIARDVRGARTWRDRLGYVFRHPGWKPVAP